MFWLFLIFVIPAILYAISFFQLTQTTPDKDMANYAYYAAMTLQVFFTGYFVIKGNQAPEMNDMKLPKSMPQMSMR